MSFRGRPSHLSMVFEPLYLTGFCLGFLGLTGCNERNRITFPSNDGDGPEVTISNPSQDTTVAAGPFAFVDGRVVDQDGIDTVYFDVTGGGASFQPHIAGGEDTVSFSLPLATNGLSGTTMTVAISGVDMGGVHGDTAFRQVTVQ